MPQIGVIGKREKILCFLAAGFHIYEAETSQASVEAVKKAENDGCAVIFISNDFKDIIPELIDMYNEKITPAVIPLPEGENEIGSELLSSFVERAVGSDILFEN